MAATHYAVVTLHLLAHTVSTGYEQTTVTRIPAFMETAPLTRTDLFENVLMDLMATDVTPQVCVCRGVLITLDYLRLMIGTGLVWGWILYFLQYFTLF